MHRAPDVIIGGIEDPYMLRWYLTPWSGLYRDIPRNQKTVWQRFVSQLPGAYLHCIMRSDDDRAMHDHPWLNISIILRGWYVEHKILAGGVHHRMIVPAWTPVIRCAAAAHRLEITSAAPVWSLFITGRRRREWGFHCPEKGWVHWREFTRPDDSGLIGKGCD